MMATKLSFISKRAREETPVTLGGSSKEEPYAGKPHVRFREGGSIPSGDVIPLLDAGSWTSKNFLPVAFNPFYNGCGNDGASGVNGLQVIVI
jgi:hypothetical protein